MTAGQGLRIAGQGLRIAGQGLRIAGQGLRIAGWNVLLCTVATALTAACGEAYRRLTVPFLETRYPYEWTPEVGMLWKPGEEQRHTNHLDYWTVQRANSLGFSDREPPTVERAIRSCHVAVVGDSFVEAREVPVGVKFHVQLEQMAGRHLPHLDITTSAFGRSGTGQINQLTYYDKYVRRLGPKVVVLVVDRSDFINNSAWLNWLAIGSRHLATTEDSLPLAYSLGAHGRIAPDGTLEMIHPVAPPSGDLGVPVAGAAGSYRSYLWTWLNAERRHHRTLAWATRAPVALLRISAYYDAPDDTPDDTPTEQETRFRHLYAREPRFDSLLRGVPLDANHNRMIHSDDPPGIYAEALALSTLAFKEFRARTARDGSALVVLTTHLMGTRNSRARATLRRIVEAAEASPKGQEVPIVGVLDYIHRQGATEEDAQFRHDAHWNASGHRWAAEALLEHIGQNQGICLR